MWRRWWWWWDRGMPGRCLCRFGLVSSSRFRCFWIGTRISSLASFCLTSVISYCQDRKKLQTLDPFIHLFYIIHARLYNFIFIVMKEPPNNNQIFDLPGHSPKTMPANNCIKVKRDDLMKFIDTGENDKSSRLYGKRCFSTNSNVSKDSPDHFQPSQTATRFLSKPQTNPQQWAGTNPRSTCHSFYPQKNYFDIRTQQPQPPTSQFLAEYMDTIETNNKAFNRKISDYSTFVNKNINSLWGQSYPLMGIQRSPDGRKLRNAEREKNIEEKMRTRETFLRTFHTGNHNLSRASRSNSVNGEMRRTGNDLLFGLRVKVRQNRNQIAKRLHMETQSYLLRQANNNNPDTLQNYKQTSTSSSKTCRPLTSSARKHKSILLSRPQFFDTILRKHGHHKNHSTLDLETANIVDESDGQASRRVQQWAEHFQNNRFDPLSKVIKKMDQFHKKLRDGKKKVV